MEQGKLYRIGEVAKMFRLSVGTLRHYEAMGILKPAYIDPDIGYRYYNVQQFECLNTIRYLRMLDFSLEQIAAFLQNRDVEKMTEMLQMQKQIARQKRLEWKRIEKKIERRLQRLEEARTARLGEIELRTVPEQRMIRIQSDLSLHTYLDMEEAIRELERELDSASVFLGKIGAGIAKERLKAGDVSSYDTAFLLLDPEDTVRGTCETFPEMRCACLCFAGSHPEAPAHYDTLLRFIREQNMEITGFSREITLIDDGLTQHAEEFVTEIQIPVQEAKKNEAVYCG
ncbi:MAG: MerR family transcriptional regulator [Fretibacterium sp.]|nr:MerR family transcriptional regulator [Fretibacterium sp.]